MFKKLCCILLIGSNILFASEPRVRKFDVAISLGEVCQTAIYLQLNGLRLEAYPLDWLISSFDGLLKFIANDGHDFINKKDLLFNVKDHVVGRGVLNTYYNLYSLHDFEYSVIGDPSKACSYEGTNIKNYEDVKKKYSRRTKRFLDVLSSNKKVLFVRLGITYKEAQILDQLLHTRYPQLDYLILAIDDTEEIKSDWKLKRVRNFYLHRQNRYISNPEDWAKILRNFDFSFAVNKPPANIDITFSVAETENVKQ